MWYIRCLTTRSLIYLLCYRNGGWRARRAYISYAKLYQPVKRLETACRPTISRACNFFYERKKEEVLKSAFKVDKNIYIYIFLRRWTEYSFFRRCRSTFRRVGRRGDWGANRFEESSESRDRWNDPTAAIRPCGRAGQPRFQPLPIIFLENLLEQILFQPIVYREKLYFSWTGKLFYSSEQFWGFRFDFRWESSYLSMLWLKLF